MSVGGVWRRARLWVNYITYIGIIYKQRRTMLKFENVYRYDNSCKIETSTNTSLIVTSSKLVAKQKGSWKFSYPVSRNGVMHERRNGTGGVWPGVEQWRIRLAHKIGEKLEVLYSTWGAGKVKLCMAEMMARVWTKLNQCSSEWKEGRLGMVTVTMTLTLTCFVSRSVPFVGDC